LLFPALMAFAAASDLFTMTISNRVSLALVAGFLVLAVLSGLGFYDILSHIGAGVTVLTVAFACFAMGWVGGGDAKVAAAAALWFGFGHLPGYLVYASLFGGGLTLLLLQFRQWPLPYPFAAAPGCSSCARAGSLWHRPASRSGGVSGDGMGRRSTHPLRHPLIGW
jgi:prepilin peptidase CpaA